MIRIWRFCALASVLFVGVLLMLGTASKPMVAAATVTPPAQVMATPDRFAPPEMPAEPTQADDGAMVYHLYCMACHGEQGQGLTEEFRAAWGEEEANCWQSKCHASNYPPGGFEFPTYVPPLIGEQTMTSHKTVLDLYTYVSQNMPFHMPGGLTEEDYWALTAFLARENGVPVGSAPLTPEIAAQLPLNGEMVVEEAPAFDIPFYVWGPLGILLLFGGVALLMRRWR